MITLWSLDNSRAFRVHWLLAELGQEFELHTYPREGGKRAPASMKSDSNFSLGKSPVLQDGELTVWESGNCLQYLAERYGAEQGFLPGTSDWAARTEVLAWLHFSESTMLHALAIIYARWFTPDHADELEASAAKNVLNDLQFLEDQLAKRASGPKFIVGDKLSIADISFTFTAEYIFGKEIALKSHEAESKYPTIVAWLREMEQRPAYDKTVREGAKHDFSLVHGAG
ncbi:glutathione S-transferase [Tilletiopsis washingtonensis]|uniref:Glutathione S-transferase n=1 Tax=Tilletiopsis washingtonensis TaxID=58919 RepID=A0A316ZGG0_9BASI|nr:glutathione S-transferase [Tilletiopsis washingtonensis]PWO00851.1 glutathione S-transferase [Tilletiopsis washingtonensis]